MSALEKPTPFRLVEAGDDSRGWVCMALFGTYACGPNRQAAWDALLYALRGVT